MTSYSTLNRVMQALDKDTHITSAIGAATSEVIDHPQTRVKARATVVKGPPGRQVSKADFIADVARHRHLPVALVQAGGVRPRPLVRLLGGGGDGRRREGWRWGRGTEGGRRRRAAGADAQAARRRLALLGSQFVRQDQVAQLRAMRLAFRGKMRVGAVRIQQPRTFQREICRTSASASNGTQVRLNDILSMLPWYLEIK